jgi:hypothetical protein
VFVYTAQAAKRQERDFTNMRNSKHIDAFQALLAQNSQASTLSLTVVSVY